MSDTRLDIERDKYAEWKQQQHWAMEDACRDCDSHKTLGCEFYDPEEETWDFEECFKVRGI